MNDKFTNHYKHCGLHWSDTGDSMHNDKCPACDKEIEPYYSDEIFPNNLDRAMWAETVLCEFDQIVRIGGGTSHRAVDDLYDPPEDVAKDLICNILHFLHLDERAGCMPIDQLQALMNSAFGLFQEEVNDEHNP